jgi:branched-chain amino acid transport system substrate-binding protein
VLRACGDNLTRESVMDHLLNLKEVEFDLLLPGITISGSPTDYRSIKQLQMMRFNGERWEGFGPIITDDYSG